MKRRHFTVPAHMPETGEKPEERLSRSIPLEGTEGQAYVERRGIPVRLAAEAGVRFDPAFGRWPAVVAAMTDGAGHLLTLHGRYLAFHRGERKMLSVGTGDGVISVLGGRQRDPLIVVEGLFDALSLAVCGFPSIATVGCWSPWLPSFAAGRQVWLAQDNGRPGEEEATRYALSLRESALKRLPPPPRCKDWNTALLKQGKQDLTRWILRRMEERE